MPSREDFDNDIDVDKSIPSQSVPKTGGAPSPQPQ